jgi:hypothetical protein
LLTKGNSFREPGPHHPPRQGHDPGHGTRHLRQRIPRGDDPYLIVATAFPANNQRPADRAFGQSATSSSLEDAQLKCVELANALKEMIQRRGDLVRGIHLKELS